MSDTGEVGFILVDNPLFLPKYARGKNYGFFSTREKAEAKMRLLHEMPEEDRKKEEVIKPKKPRAKRVKDIVKKKYDGREYYVNRFLDYEDAYGVVNGKVMIIGTIGDHHSLDLFDEPKSVDKKVRFYNDDIPNKPIKLLNDLQEKE
jgi:hypothetical protein